jgi:ankyrin repeat protein
MNKKVGHIALSAVFLVFFFFPLAWGKESDKTRKWKWSGPEIAQSFFPKVFAVLEDHGFSSREIRINPDSVKRIYQGQFRISLESVTPEKANQLLREILNLPTSKTFFRLKDIFISSSDALGIQGSKAPKTGQRPTYHPGFSLKSEFRFVFVFDYEDAKGAFPPDFSEEEIRKVFDRFQNLLPWLNSRKSKVLPRNHAEVFFIHLGSRENSVLGTTRNLVDPLGVVDELNATTEKGYFHLNSVFSASSNSFYKTQKEKRLIHSSRENIRFPKNQRIFVIQFSSDEKKISREVTNHWIRHLAILESEFSVRFSLNEVECDLDRFLPLGPVTLFVDSGNRADLERIHRDLADFSCGEVSIAHVNFLPIAPRKGVSSNTFKVQFSFPETEATIRKLGPNKRLSLAISREDNAIIRNLIQNGAALDGIDSPDNDPKMEDRETSLLEKRLPPENEPPLFAAMEWENKKALKTLLALNADVNKKSNCTDSINFGKFPLHAAAEADQVDYAYLLIKHGANVNARNNQGETALHTAVQTCGTRFLRLLLAAGADPNQHSSEKVAPLYLAVKGKRLSAILPLLKAGASVNPTIPGEEPAILAAAKNGDWKGIQLLLSNGADFNLKGKDGEGILHRALDSCWNLQGKAYFSFLEKIIKLGPDVNLQDDRGWTPLHSAIAHFPSVAVGSARMIWKNGARLDIKTQDGETPIALAKRFKRSAIFSYPINGRMQSNFLK